MSAIVPGLGFTRLRGVLLMLGEAVSLVFGGTSRIGMVYVHLFKVLAKSESRVDELTRENIRLQRELERLIEDEAQDEPSEYDQVIANTCSPEETKRRTDAATATLASMGIGLPTFNVSRLEVIDHTPTGTGRDYVKPRCAGQFKVEFSMQDQGRTLKVLLK